MPRKAIAFTIGFASAVFVSALTGTGLVTSALAALLLAGCIVCTVIRLKKRRRALTAAALVLAGLAAGLALCRVHTRLFYEDALMLSGEISRQIFEVTDLPLEYETYSAVRVKTLARPEDPLRRRYTVRMICDGDITLEPGDLVMVTGELYVPREGTDFDTRAYYRAKGIYLFLRTESLRQISIAGRDALRFLPLVIRDRLTRAIDMANGDTETASFYRALLLGDKSGLSAKFRSDLSDAGLSHIVAVSGMHLSFLTGAILLLLRGKKGAVAAMAAVVLFASVTGFPPSVVRAGVMQLLALSGVLFGREADGLNSMCIALCLILLCNPYSITDTGLVLSFLATLGILLYAEKMKTWIFSKFNPEHAVLGKAYRYAVTVICVSLTAQLFTTPAIALYFSRLSLVAPLANLLLLWAISILFPLNMIYAAVCAVFPGAAAAGTVIAQIPAELLMRAVGLFAGLPGAAIGMADTVVLAGFLSLYAVLLAGILLRKKEKAVRIAAPALAVLLLAVFIPVSVYRHNHTLVLTALDVGQGQTLLLSQGGHTVVLDCGGGYGRQAGVTAADQLKKQNAGRIDALILSHLDADHISGALDLLMLCGADRLILPPGTDHPKQREELYRAAESVGAKVVLLLHPQTLKMKDLRLTLYPPAEDAVNGEACIMAFADAFGYDIMVPADVYAGADGRYPGFQKLPRSELMVAAHHGSKKAVTKTILDEVCPETVILSAGPNSYGLPSPEALELYGQSGVSIYRTDLLGTVTVRITRRHVRFR